MKDKNKYGQYFTVDTIAQFMVSMIEHGKEAAVLEPSCGEGVFLKHLAQAGFDNVTAYEIDNTLNNPFPNVRYESFISSPMIKFDVAIGNPPYIRWKNLEPELKEELSESPLWNKYFNSLCDYLFIFILKSIEQLNDGGELIFICTEYWMNTTHSASLRDYMSRHGWFSEIYHFKEAPLFEGVCASFIVFRYVKGRHRRESIKLYRYNKVGAPSINELSSRSCFDGYSIRQFEEGERWLLATDDQQELLSSFESHCRKESDNLFSSGELYRVGDFCDIGNGMVSGLDKAFNVTKITDLNPIEEKATICVLKAKDLDYYRFTSKSKYFFIRDRISEKEFEDSMPNFFGHMSPYKEDLGKRYNYGKDTKYWEFIFPRNLALFERPEQRIFVPCKERISNKNHFRFVLAENGYYPLQDVTGILKKPNCRESIEYITAYLNNERVFEWLSFNGIVKGYIVEFSEAPIASIPYRPIDWNSPKEVELHDKITKAVREYIQENATDKLNAINNYFNTLFA